MDEAQGRGGSGKFGLKSTSGAASWRHRPWPPAAGGAGGPGGGRADNAQATNAGVRLRGQATIQAQADAFARNMAGTLAALEREGITSSTAMAKALNERGVATAAVGAGAAER